MVTVYCRNDECDGELMEITDEDCRQEWYKATYQCPKCDNIKIHRREFDQNGLVLSDVIEND